MNHYPHHIGDFDRATRHLTRLERSVYRDLLDMYYDTETRLPLDLKFICRKIIARSDEESTAVEQVLNEFFEKTDTGYWHERCELEIEAYRNHCGQKAMAGKASAAKKAAARERALNGGSTAVDLPLNGSVTAGNGDSTNHEPEPLTTISPPTPPASRGGETKSPRAVGVSFPEGFGLDSACADGLAEDVKAVARVLHGELKVDWQVETLRHHLSAFRSHYAGRSGRAGRSANWLATWESWCRRAMCEHPMADPVRRDRQGAAANARSRDSPGAPPVRWDATLESLAAEGARFGISARPGETHGQFKERVAVARAGLPSGGVAGVRPIEAMMPEKFERVGV